MTFTTGPRFLLTLGLEGEKDGYFMSPRGIATDFADNVWVADTGNSRFQKFSSNNAYIAKFSSEGIGNGQLKKPEGIAVDSEGNLNLDRRHGQRPRSEVQQQRGIPLQIRHRRLGKRPVPGTDRHRRRFRRSVWIADTGNDRVQKFNSKGEYLSKFGTEGSENGQFQEPTGIAVDSEGNVWIADTGNDRVQKFNSKGEYLSKFGTEGSESGQFQEPTGIAVDSEGGIYIADTGNDRVQEFDSEGKYFEEIRHRRLGKRPVPGTDRHRRRLGRRRLGGRYI